MSVVLEAKGLTKAFGGVVAVDDVSFQLHRGELLALIGPNGAGKSTCFNMLMGQLPPTSGEVFLSGERINGLSPRQIWRKGVGRTFQITATYTSMTVVENVQMALLSHNGEIFRILPYAHQMYREPAMELLEIEAERTLSREEAAAWLRDLADQLARNNPLQFRNEGLKYTVRVPAQVTMEVEVEVENDGAKLEVELSW